MQVKEKGKNKMSKDKKTKKIQYWLNCDEARKFPLILFDLLGFKQNIVVSFFRAANLLDEGFIESFEQKVKCKIIRDVTRKDSFCIFIPKIESNLELYELIEQIYEEAEFTFFPSIKDLESLLYSWENIIKKNAVAYGICPFEARFDVEHDTKFYFDLEYFESKKIDSVLKEWEKTFGDFKWRRV